MIYYNFPKRGPFEYDKFVLSILQYCNEIENLRETLEKREDGFKEQYEKLTEELASIRRENHSERLLGIIEMIK